MPVMWYLTAPAWPVVLPIFFELGVAPGACVYLIFVPLGNGPKMVPEHAAAFRLLWHRLLLCAGHKRPDRGRCGLGQLDERPPPHSWPLNPLATREYGSTEASPIAFTNGGLPAH